MRQSGGVWEPSAIMWDLVSEKKTAVGPTPGLSTHPVTKRSRIHRRGSSARSSWQVSEAQPLLISEAQHPRMGQALPL